MKRIILVFATMIVCFLANNGMSANSNDSEDLSFLLGRVPENHKIAYAGKIDSKTFYLISRLLNGPCERLRVYIGQKD